ncbi:MAG TPA: hypothetical protein VFA88_04040, partial [Gaiellaceae bacterium]|nr:hypothetical protein [Gaiellaceae bacterium]
MALAIAAGGVTWALLRNTGSKSTPAPPARPAAARATSVPQLERLAASLHQPIFWIGPENGDTYELTRLANGTIYVRYLPAGVHVGASKPYLTVVTYPFPGAFAAIQKQASARGA